MNLHSLPTVFGHLLDLMKVSIMYYTVESLFSMMCLRHCQGPVYVHIF